MNGRSMSRSIARSSIIDRRFMALLTVRAAAAQLGVGYSTLKHWIYDGTVRTTTTAGGHHRIAESEIARLLAKAGRAAPARSREGARSSEPARLIVALSGRNRLRGFVEEVRVDGLLAQVRLRIGDQRLTAVITGDAVQELRLKRGDSAIAVIKSTEVMIAKEVETAVRGARSLDPADTRRETPRRAKRR
jgi:molybdopterin-binding protein